MGNMEAKHKGQRAGALKFQKEKNCIEDGEAGERGSSEKTADIFLAISVFFRVCSSVSLNIS